MFEYNYIDLKDAEHESTLSLHLCFCGSSKSVKEVIVEYSIIAGICMLDYPNLSTFIIQFIKFSVLLETVGLN